MIEIKPCPFCGDNAMIVKVEGDAYPFRVQCIKVSCSCRTDDYTEYKDALNAWNRRADMRGDGE